MRDRDIAEQVSGWFKAAMRDTLESNPHAVLPSNPDCQGPTGPHPYTDIAYKAGVEIAEQIMRDRATGAELSDR